MKLSIDVTQQRRQTDDVVETVRLEFVKAKLQEMDMLIQYDFFSFIISGAHICWVTKNLHYSCINTATLLVQLYKGSID